MEKLKLNKDRVVKNAIKAYREKRLSAQGPTPRCAYRDPSNNPCVIGVSMTDRQARYCDAIDTSSVNDLYNKDIIETDDIAFLNILQKHHDKWADDVANSLRNEDRVREREFCRLLGIEPNSP